ncbi:hypothetical protein OAS73_03600 [Luminiphilus sp.]|nr:hypothetical protein [Luminiphilus sp.]
MGRYESLQTDFDTCCQRIGIPTIALPHKRQAVERTQYRQYYDEETQALVAERFAADIAAFGYAF